MEVLERDDIQLIQSDIDIICADYIDSLPYPENISKPACFMGLLEYLYKRCIKPIFKSASGKELDFEFLDKAFFNLYIPLTSRYSVIPSIIQFCCLMHIDKDNITDIKNGIYSTSGRRVNPDKTLIVKKWYQVIESGYVSSTSNLNSVGSLFLLKSKFGYQEQNTLTIQADMITHDTAEQIASRHNNVLLPEKPEINTD